jgi:hypothetical protein
MNEVLQQMIYYIASYLAVILIGFFLINFMSNGFFTKFFIVKGSRGKKVLLKIHSVTDVYFVPGRFEESMLLFKDRAGNKKRISAKRNCVYRAMGVNCVEIDESTNAIITKNFEAIEGHDAAKTDNLIVRAIELPAQEDKREKIMMLLIVGIAILCLAIAFIVYNNYSALQSLSNITVGTV